MPKDAGCGRGCAYADVGSMEASVSIEAVCEGSVISNKR